MMGISDPIWYRRSSHGQPARPPWTTASPPRILCSISEGSAAGVVESERLARRYFTLFGQQAFETLREVVHADVVFELKAVQPGHVVRGRDEFIRFLEEELRGHLWEAVPQVFTPLDENRVIVEGRIRWSDDEHVLRDDSRFWALEFCDGLLIFSAPAGSMIEAESILAARRTSP